MLSMLSKYIEIKVEKTFGFFLFQSPLNVDDQFVCYVIQNAIV